MRTEYDFAVIGAGLVGAALARGLALAGHRVVVLDEGDRANRASRGNFALVWLQSKGLGQPAYAKWTRRSVTLWPEFAQTLAQETGVDVGLEQRGGFQLALSEAELDRLAEQSARLNRQPGMTPYPYDLLDGKEIRRRLPAAGPQVAGGTYCSLDGHVNALRLFRATHLAMIRAGADYCGGHRVDRIEANDGFRLITEGRPVIGAGRIVLAAGLGNPRLGAMVGLNVPVRPQRGQILVTERTRRFLDVPMSTVRQTDEGSVLIGDSQEETGLHDEVGTAVLSVMASRAAKMFPIIGSLNVLRTWACLRILSPDGFPFYDESKSHQGAFLTTCHSGVTLAAAHALALAPALARSRLPEELQPFSTERFDVQKAN